MMKKPTLLRRIIVTAVLIGCWILFAPPQLGGQMSWVTTSGNSMKPEINRGDLVMVHRMSSYSVGDVVAYRSQSLRTIVLHRIVGKEGIHYILKGDHNSWTDTDHPTADQFVGKMVLHVPKLGGRLLWFKTPLGAIVLVAVLLAIGFATRNRKTTSEEKEVSGATGDPPDETGGKRERPKLHVKPPYIPKPHLHKPQIGVKTFRKNETLLVVARAFGGAFLAITAFAFVQSTDRVKIGEIIYNHKGEFSYTAPAGGGSTVYKDGKVRTGDPIYLTLANQIHTEFTYNFDTTAKSKVTVYGAYLAEIKDADGWTRTLELESQKAVAGRSIKLSGNLNLTDLSNYINDVENLTGVKHASYSVTLAPKIAVHTVIGNRPLDEAFTPRYTFQFNKAQLTVASSGPKDDNNSPEPGKGGSVTAPISKPNVLKMFGLHVTMSALRVIGICGLGIVSVILYPSWRRRIRQMRGLPPVAEQSLDYSQWIIEVSPSSIDRATPATPATGIEALAELAQQTENMIFHAVIDSLDVYQLTIDGAIHRYERGHDPEQRFGVHDSEGLAPEPVTPAAPAEPMTFDDAYDAGYDDMDGDE